MNTQPSTSVTVLDTNNNILFRQDFAPNNNNQCNSSIANWAEQYAKSRPGFGLLQGLVMTRIDSTKNFAKDFFVPTVVNLAAKVENLAGRFFACFFAAILDVASLPIRVLAFPIWAIYKACNPEEDHPLTSLIRNGPASLEQIANALKNGLVRCEYTTHICSIQDSELGPIATEHDTKGSLNVALKRMPGGNKSKKSEETTIKMSKQIEGEWCTLTETSGKSSNFFISF